MFFYSKMISEYKIMLALSLKPLRNRVNLNYIKIIFNLVINPAYFNFFR